MRGTKHHLTSNEQRLDEGEARIAVLKAARTVIVRLDQKIYLQDALHLTVLLDMDIDMDMKPSSYNCWPT
jgi:hypothetical protein